MKLYVDHDLNLESIEELHSKEVFDVAVANRSYLAQWLPWVSHMQDETFIQNFIKGSLQRTAQGLEQAFVIREHGQLVGRIGAYKIDRINKTAEIGYWVASSSQGKHIVTRSCKTLVEYCFDQLQLNRIEIRCAQENIKSQHIPPRVGFTYEGTLRQAEWLHGTYVDLKLYSLLKTEWQPCVSEQG